MNSKTLNIFFKLREKRWKFEEKVYADCLERYFDTSRTVGQVTIPDLQNTLGQLQGKLFDYDNKNTANLQFDIGEHVAVFWVEGSGTMSGILELLSIYTLDQL